MSCELCTNYCDSKICNLCRSAVINVNKNKNVVIPEAVLDEYMEASQEIQGEEYLESGKRDSSHKPPRHFFYTKGVSAYLIEAQAHDHAAIVEYVDELIDKLNTYPEIAHFFVSGIITKLREMYDGFLISDVSYVVEMGARKYGHSNYTKGMNFSLCISSFMGHLLKHALLEENDEESGHNHLLHCAANMLMLLGYLSDKEMVKRFNDIPRM